ncbi:MAG: enoyl-CoA hydratase/isomerase family protein [Sphingomonadaceae bacterium]
MSQEIRFARMGRLGIATLTRPHALNALTRDMCGELHRQLIEWLVDASVEAVVVEGEGDRAFCAGGDVVAMHAAGKAGDGSYAAFFHDEYRLNQAIAHYPKPYIALMDGITMGGGVGISIHAPYRVATEATLFAMPEAGIGFITDVGATHALPRLPGEIGEFLGLTGARIGPADCRTAEIATHYVPRAELELLKERLAHAHESVGQVLDTFDADPGPDMLTALREGIDYHFARDSVEAMLASLDEGDDWANDQARHMRTLSPTSLKLILHALREGDGETIESCLRREYRIVCNMERGGDFYEGVRAQLIDKDRAPRWNPPTLAEVEIEPYLEEPPAGDLDFD